MTQPHRPEPFRRSWSRRHFLGQVSACAASAALVPLRPASGQEAVELTFAFGPDESGTQQALIDAFNRAHEGEIHVRYLAMPRASDDYFRRMVSEFNAGSAEIDVFGGDVVWTAEFASQGWIEDVTGLFFGSFELDDFLRAPRDSVAFYNRAYGVPWFTDAGMLYYRRDLLEEAGFDRPPATWDELIEIARAVVDAGGARTGFVFQGEVYEGGVTNALEYIWNAGGRVHTGLAQVSAGQGAPVLEASSVVVDSIDAARGLDDARRLIEAGVAPPEVAGFDEFDGIDRFRTGEAVFMRNWPFAYALLTQGEGALSPDQVSAAPLPVSRAGNRSYSCLGGWNLMINALSAKREAVWTFIEFAVAPEQQRMRATRGGFLPSLAALYEDEAVRQALPIAVLGREAVRNARARPATPNYSQLSPRTAIAFNRVLRGELTGREAVVRLQRELRAIVRGS